MVAILSVILNAIEMCKLLLYGEKQGAGRDIYEVREGKGRVIIDKKTQLVIFFSGLRGAMSFALVENIPLYDIVTGKGSRYKPELKAMTSSCIFFTIFLFGGSTYYLLQDLGFTSKQPVRERVLADDTSLLKDSIPLMESIPLKTVPSEKRLGVD
eukprot:CAMPEP_0194324302 /NCGR_PEP_ID=MMETSP0171-20130528/27305_1 /TAXON_ID=218684 /ORGANISM="Corethron pennatum, Strain L29A3" /LENGTH=154 /DNA_ID=CAMNT_0039083167 /DNA_START=93 /DNA_END=557 /DNA_ORIENTATION=-